MHDLAEMPYAEPLLLLAVKQQGLKDPGIRFKSAPRAPLAAHADVLSATVDRHSIAGSMLAVLCERRPKGIWKLPLLQGLFRRLHTRILIVGGPLLARGTRLENEYTLKALVQTLCQQSRCPAKNTRFIQLFDESDLLPLFREMGFRWLEQTYPAHEPFFESVTVKARLDALTPDMRNGYGSFVRK